MAVSHIILEFSVWKTKCKAHCSVLYLQTITTPSMAVSHIMLEAYKKYILVALMLHGKVGRGR